MTASRREILAGVEWIRALDPDMPSQTLSTFLYVSIKGVCSQSELTEHLGMSQSTASRNIASLSKRHRLNKPGLDLVESREDPSDRRYKVLSLTPKGKKVSAMLEGLTDSAVDYPEKRRSLNL